MVTAGNRSRGARRLAEQGDDVTESISIDETPADATRRANRARLNQKVYEVDPPECNHWPASMRIIAPI